MHFLTPFTQIVKYYSPDGKGVYAKPHTDALPDGWGEPRRDDSGAVIYPGTPGGPHNRTLIAEKDGVYAATSSKYMQKAGCITWWGDYRYPLAPEKGRHVLSYNGPRLRYFRENDFTYGSTEAHNEIYYAGSYAAVAPGPVLGACMRKLTFVDPLDGVSKEDWFIFAAVYRNGQDEFYRKRWGLRLTRPDIMNDAVRAAAMEMYNIPNRPYGWDLIGTYARPSSEYISPETPWFFNKSGTAAACVRRKRITFDNGSGTDVTEDQFERRTAVITSTRASVLNLGVSPPMEYVEKIKKLHPAPYTSVDSQGHTHQWQEDHVTVDITLRGEHWVMCDYLDDVLHWGKVKYEMLRLQASYYTEGIDPVDYVVTYNGSPYNISNNGMRVGPYWHDYNKYGYINPTYVPQQADHEASDWIDITELVRLYYGPEGSEEDFYISLHEYASGSETEWAGRTDSDDTVLYFYTFFTRFIRSMFDIRDLALLSAAQLTYGLLLDNSTVSTVTTEVNETLYTSDNLPDGEAYYSVKETISGLVEFGWPWQDMETWPETIDEIISIQTYTGAWPKDNNTGDVSKPGNKTFYDPAFEHAIWDWPTIGQLLYGANNDAPSGNGVRTETQTLCFSVEIPDLGNPGKFVILSDHKPGGSVESLVGFGKKFYPVGTC